MEMMRAGFDWSSASQRPRFTHLAVTATGANLDRVAIAWDPMTGITFPDNTKSGVINR